MIFIVIAGFLLGFLLAITGGIWGLVQAFQEDSVWGLLYLLVPFASLVFYIKKWGKRHIRKTFFLQIIGIGVMLLSSGLGGILGRGAVVSNPKLLKPNPSLEPTQTQAPEIAPTVEPTQTLPSSPVTTSKPDPFSAALDRGMNAAILAQSANTENDWKLVASKWQEAIGLLKTVPQEHPNYGKVQNKIAEYQQNLAIARQKAAGK